MTVRNVHTPGQNRESAGVTEGSARNVRGLSLFWRRCLMNNGTVVSLLAAVAVAASVATAGEAAEGKRFSISLNHLRIARSESHPIVGPNQDQVIWMWGWRRSDGSFNSGRTAKGRHNWDEGCDLKTRADLVRVLGRDRIPTFQFDLPDEQAIAINLMILEGDCSTAKERDALQTSLIPSEDVKLCEVSRASRSVAPALSLVDWFAAVVKAYQDIVVGLERNDDDDILGVLRIYARRRGSEVEWSFSGALGASSDRLGREVNLTGNDVDYRMGFDVMLR